MGEVRKSDVWLKRRLAFLLPLLMFGTPLEALPPTPSTISSPQRIITAAQCRGIIQMLYRAPGTLFYKIIHRPYHPSELGNERLFEGEGPYRDKVKKLAKQLYRAIPISHLYESISRDEFKAIEKEVDEAETAYFDSDPVRAASLYGTPDPTVKDCLFKILERRQERIRKFMSADRSLVLNRQMVSTLRTSKTTLKVVSVLIGSSLITAIGMGILQGVYFQIPATAVKWSFGIRQFILNGGKKDKSDLETTELIELTELTNIYVNAYAHKTDPQIIAREMILKLGTFVTQHSEDMEKAAKDHNQEKIETLLQGLYSVDISFRDVLRSPLCESFRKTIDECYQKYDPDHKLRDKFAANLTLAAKPATK